MIEQKLVEQIVEQKNPKDKIIENIREMDELLTKLTYGVLKISDKKSFETRTIVNLDGTPNAHYGKVVSEALTLRMNNNAEYDVMKITYDMKQLLAHPIQYYRKAQYRRELEQMI